MLAAYAVSQSSSDPLSGLVIDQRPDPVVRPGWSVVKLRAAGLNLDPPANFGPGSGS
jgi:hypothetical protein